jgi:hypothetical protein
MELQNLPFRLGFDFLEAKPQLAYFTARTVTLAKP